MSNNQTSNNHNGQSQTATAPATVAKPILPWEQQPGETSKAFWAFFQYLQLGPSTTLDEFAQKIGRTRSSVWQLSSRHQWRERAGAWHEHLANIRLNALAAATQEKALANFLAHMLPAASPSTPAPATGGEETPSTPRFEIPGSNKE